MARLLKQVPGILTLEGQISSDNLIVNQGTLKANLSNIITSPFLTVESSGILDLNSTSQTVATLNGNGNILLGNGFLTVTSNNSGPSSFSGSISGTGAIAVTGTTNSLTLIGNNTYSGGTDIGAYGFGGLINISAGNNLGSGNIYFSGGKLFTDADLTLPQTIYLNQGLAQGYAPDLVVGLYTQQAELRLRLPDPCREMRLV